MRFDLSFSGTEIPLFSFPASMQRSSHAILCARFRIVWSPSRSRLTSSGVLPCTMFQYEDETAGISAIVKYLLRTSTDAVVPARRAEAIAAPGLCAKTFRDE